MYDVIPLYPISLPKPDERDSVIKRLKKWIYIVCLKSMIVKFSNKDNRTSNAKFVSTKFYKVFYYGPYQRFFKMKWGSFFSKYVDLNPNLMNFLKKTAQRRNILKCIVTMLYVTVNILHDLHRKMAASSKFSTLP